jgi:hypothetical protein
MGGDEAVFLNGGIDEDRTSVWNLGRTSMKELKFESASTKFGEPSGRTVDAPVSLVPPCSLGELRMEAALTYERNRGIPVSIQVQRNQDQLRSSFLPSCPTGFSTGKMNQESGIKRRCDHAGGFEVMVTTRQGNCSINTHANSNRRFSWLVLFEVADMMCKASVYMLRNLRLFSYPIIVKLP